MYLQNVSLAYKVVKGHLFLILRTLFLNFAHRITLIGITASDKDVANKARLAFSTVRSLQKKQS
jgi:hypothetical protein